MIRFSMGMLSLLLLLTFAGQAWGKETDPDCEAQLAPTLYDLNIVDEFQPQPVRFKSAHSSPGVIDPVIEYARQVKAFEDFKFLADLEARTLDETSKAQVFAEAEQLRGRAISRGHTREKADQAYARWLINHLFRFRDELIPIRTPSAERQLELNSGDTELDRAFEGVEQTWTLLTRRSPDASNGSLIPSPYPMVVAGGRFREAYYWDAYFGALGLIATGRRDLAAAQLENFLHMIQNFGRVPNGFRDYYLSRSQPPVISMMALAVYEYTANTDSPRAKKWLVERVFPLLRRDYHDFWMKLRFDTQTGLNFYSDDLNEIRPERHANDDDTKLGDTFRDVRAQAESGLDHTDALMSDTSQVASVSLNALLYRYEMDLARIADIASQPELAQHYRLAADRRKFAIDKFLWDANAGSYRNYSLVRKVHSDVIHADQFAMLYVGAAAENQAALLERRVLNLLEREGGLAASSVKSGKQWDGDHGWAPLHVMAIQGLANYGYHAAAQRLAWKWARTVAHSYAQTGVFLEKIDVSTGETPREDGSKYPTQTGFLWTNASYVWTLQFLGFKFNPRVSR